MPKPNHYIDPHLISFLKNKIQTEIGVLVQSYSDCKRLSEQIFKLKKIKISTSTLYRLYFEKQDNHFFISTLDLLLNVIEEKKTWNEFSQEQDEIKTKLGHLGIQLHGADNPSLIERSLEFDSWKPLCKWFEDLSILTTSNLYPNYLDSLGFHLRVILEFNPQWEKKFYQKTSHFPFIKTSFFEMGTDPTFPLIYSEIGFQFYKKTLNKNSKSFENDSLYIDTLECLYFFKKKNPIGQKLYSRIKLKYTINLNNIDQFHLFNLSRFWALELYDWNQKNKNWKSFNWSEFLGLIRNLVPMLNDFEKRILRFTLLDACLFTAVPKAHLETLLIVLEINEIRKYSSDKIKHYLLQINPNESNWRKQFSHF